MPRAGWLRRASWVTLTVGVACGTNTMDLLPLGVGGGTPSGAAGTGGGGGSEPMTAGGSAAGGGGTGGAAAGTGGDAAAGSGGAPSGGGGAASGDGGCSGVGCGGDTGGQGGDFGECPDFGFCPCGPQGQCRATTRCNERLGLCLYECDGPRECPDGFLCEENTCAPCTENAQCERYGPFARTVCVNGRCEECVAPSDCPLESPICFGRRCVECVTNDDCVSGLCNKWGRCDK